MLFAVFDTETTGFNKHKDVSPSEQPRCIEFAGIITDGEKILSEYEAIINPGCKIEQIITDITGLTNEELAQHPRFDAFTLPICSYFKQADVVIAQNLSFDKQIMLTETALQGITLDDIAWPLREICTVEQTFHQFGRRMKLSELYQREFGEYTQKHRALDDVRLLHNVCQRYRVYEAALRAYA